MTSKIENIGTSKIYTAKYTCNPGHHLTSSNETTKILDTNYQRQCSPDGMIDEDRSFLSPNVWSGVEPKCQKIGSLRYDTIR